MKIFEALDAPTSETMIQQFWEQFDNGDEEYNADSHALHDSKNEDFEKIIPPSRCNLRFSCHTSHVNL